MFTPTAPDGLFLNEENPALALNTYHKDLSTFLNNLNYRRLHVQMAVNILSAHNNAVVGTGIIIEIIPPQEFSGVTGQYHEAVVSVRFPNQAVHHYSAERVIPTTLSGKTLDVEHEIPCTAFEDRHYSVRNDD